MGADQRLGGVGRFSATCSELADKRGRCGSDGVRLGSGPEYGAVIFFLECGSGAQLWKGHELHEGIVWLRAEEATISALIAS